ncbi:hypothetical protein G6O67_003382 [Ophiocordyceps sinensis]|uniref:Uncharacterized protein n=1 Tax=Ophiocordyceps sinensis TaxID=72228 RepID=A0A8H4PW40_9HYPO|nr:hypothetical protein G6O67_003382 [Ophiocordyceps sinensis]
MAQTALPWRMLLCRFGHMLPLTRRMRMCRRRIRRFRQPVSQGREGRCHDAWWRLRGVCGRHLVATATPLLSSGPVHVVDGLDLVKGIERAPGEAKLALALLDVLAHRLKLLVDALEAVRQARPLEVRQDPRDDGVDCAKGGDGGPGAVGCAQGRERGAHDELDAQADVDGGVEDAVAARGHLLGPHHARVDAHVFGDALAGVAGRGQRGDRVDAGEGSEDEQLVVWRDQGVGVGTHDCEGSFRLGPSLRARRASAAVATPWMLRRARRGHQGRTALLFPVVRRRDALEEALEELGHWTVRPRRRGSPFCFFLSPRRSPP